MSPTKGTSPRKTCPSRGQRPPTTGLHGGISIRAQPTAGPLGLALPSPASPTAPPQAVTPEHPPPSYRWTVRVSFPQHLTWKEAFPKHPEKWSQGWSPMKMKCVDRQRYSARAGREWGTDTPAPPLPPCDPLPVLPISRSHWGLCSPGSASWVAGQRSDVLRGGGGRQVRVNQDCLHVLPLSVQFCLPLGEETVAPSMQLWLLAAPGDVHSVTF